VVPHLPPAGLTRGARYRGAARAAIVAVLCALFARGFVLELRVVASGSMAPTLETGDRVLVDRLLYAADLPRALAWALPTRAPARGDVVLARSPEDPRVAVIKRVVALGGERAAGEVVPPDGYFLVGDRRDDSRDSRDFGPVSRPALRGRVVVAVGGAGRSRLPRAVR
jgi:signal peptidase I